MTFLCFWILGIRELFRNGPEARGIWKHPSGPWRLPWEKVEKAYAKLYPGADPLGEEILSDFSGRNDKKFNNWLASLDPSLAFDQQALSTYTNKEDNQNLPPKAIKDAVNEFNDKFLQKEPKYEKFVNKKQGLKIWNAWQRILLKKLKTESQKSKPPGMSVKKFRCTVWGSEIDPFIFRFPILYI